MEYYYERKTQSRHSGKKYMSKKKAYKEANPEKEAEWMRKTLEKRAKDPERMQKLKDYKKNYRENVKNDPEKLEKQREYQREYMRKRRLKAKEDKLKNNAEASDGRAHSAELGEGQSKLMEANGNTSNNFYKRACQIVSGRPDPMKRVLGDFNTIEDDDISRINGTPTDQRSGDD